MYEYFLFFFLFQQLHDPQSSPRVLWAESSCIFYVFCSRKNKQKGIKNATMFDSKQVYVLGHYKVCVTMASTHEKRKKMIREF